MRRIWALGCLLLLASKLASAQSCRGLAPFSTGTIQVMGEGSVDPESSTLAAGLGYKLVRGLFTDGSVGTRSSNTFEGSSLVVGATVGYQVALGNLYFCPVASAGLGIGPNKQVGSGEDRSRRSARIGLSAGTVFQGPSQWQVVPTVGLLYQYQKDQAENNAGTPLFQIANYYLVSQVGIGMVLRNFSIRPYAELPLSFTEGDPSVGVSISVQLGRRSGTDLGPVP